VCVCVCVYHVYIYKRMFRVATKSQKDVFMYTLLRRDISQICFETAVKRKPTNQKGVTVHKVHVTSYHMLTRSPFHVLLDLALNL